MSNIFKDILQSEAAKASKRLIVTPFFGGGDDEPLFSTDEPLKGTVFEDYKPPSNLPPGTEVDAKGKPIGRYGGAFLDSELEQGRDVPPPISFERPVSTPFSVYGSGDTVLEKMDFDFNWKPPEELDLKKPDDWFLELSPEEQEDYVRQFGEKSIYKDQLREIELKEFNKRKEEILKAKRPIKEGYIEPGKLGQAKEAITQSAVSVLSALGSSVEKLGARLNKPTIEKAGADFADDMLKKILSNPEWGPPEDMGKWEDPDFYIRGVSNAVPSIAGGILLSVLGGLAGGPVGAVGTGVTFASSLEGGAAFRELQEAGVTGDDLQKASDKIGVINGILEFLPIGRVLNKIPGGKAVKGKLIGRIVSEFTKQGITEGTTEAAQEIVSNVIMDELVGNREVFDNVLESFVFGFVAGGIFGGVTSIFTAPETQQAVETIAQDTRGEAVMPIPEGRQKPKTTRLTKNQILNEQAERAIQAEAYRSETAGMSDEDIKLFDKIRRSKNKTFAEGDLETMRQNPTWRSQIETAIERYNEATGQELVDTDAFDQIMNLPSLQQIREAERELNLKEQRILRQSELESLRSRIKTAESKAKSDADKIKYIQGVKEAIIDYAKKNLKLHERGKLLPTIKNVGINKVDGKVTAKGFDAAMKEYADAIEKMDKLSSQSSIRDTKIAINKELKKFTSKKKEKGKTSVKYELIRNGYKQILNNTTKENAALESELQKKMDDNIDLQPQDIITYALLSESNKGIKDMDLNELETVLSNIKSRRDIARESFLIKEINRAIKIANDIDDSVENMRSPIDKPQSANKNKQTVTDVVDVLDVFDRGYRKIMDKIDNMRGGKFFNHVLYRPIQKANNVFFEMENTYLEKDKQIFNDIFGKDKNRFLAKGSRMDYAIYKFRKQKYIKDLKIWLSQAEMTDIYISLKMKDNAQALMESGMYIGGKNPDNRVLLFTEDTQRIINENISTEGKQLADYIIKEINDPGFSKLMADAYMDKWNKPFPYVDGGYWTMIRRYMGSNKGKIDLLGNEQEYKATLSPQSFKERVDNDNPLLIRDAFSKFFKWRNDVSRFIAYDKAFSNISSVIRSKDFKSEFTEQFGNAAYGQLIDSFEFVVKGGKAYSDIFARIFNETRRIMSVMFIGFKTRNILSQGTSAIAGMAEVDATEFLKGLAYAVANPGEAYSTMNKSPIIKYRHKKANFSKGMFEQEMNAYRKNRIDPADTSMILTKIGDKSGVVGSGYGVYYAKLKEYKKDYNLKTAKEMALDDAVNFVGRTQQSSLPEDANWIKRQHPIISISGSFQQAQSMYRAEWYDAVSRWKNDPKKWSKSSMSDLAKKVIAYQFVLPGMYEVSRGNWNPISLFTKTFLSPISGFMGVGKVVEYGIMYAFIMAVLPLLDIDKDEWKNLLPFDPSSLPGESLKLFKKTVKSMGDIFGKDYDKQDILNFIDGSAALLKIPSKNIREEYYKIDDFITGKNRSFKRLIQTKWQAEQDEKKQKNPNIEYIF